MATCPKCGGEVGRVSFGYPAFRWTCVRCQRNYGYNTDRPMFMEGWRLLTKNELVKARYFEGKTGEKDTQGQKREEVNQKPPKVASENYRRENRHDG